MNRPPPKKPADYNQEARVPAMLRVRGDQIIGIEDHLGNVLGMPLTVKAAGGPDGEIGFDQATKNTIAAAIPTAADGVPVYVGIGKSQLSFYALGTQNGAAAVSENQDGITFTSQSGMWFDITLPNLYAARLMPSAFYIDVWSDDWTAIDTLSYYALDSGSTNFWYRAFNNKTSSFNAAPAMAASGTRRLYADTSSLTVGGGTPDLATTQILKHKIRVTPRTGRVANFRLLKVQYDVLDTPCIAITFDDNYSSVITNAQPVLDARGLKASFGVIADVVGLTARYCTIDQLKSWNAAGHECCTHGPRGDYGSGNFFTNNATLADSASDMQYNLNFLLTNGLNVNGSAYALIWPQGQYWDENQYEADGLKIARDLGFTHARSTIMPAFFHRKIATGEHQRYALPIIGHLNGTGGSEATNITNINNAIIESAAKRKSCILMFHEVGNAAAGSLDISVANFTTLMSTVSALVAQGMITNKLFSKILQL